MSHIECLERRVLLAAVPIFRVNAGGAALAGAPNWSADTTAAPSPYSNAGATGNWVASTSSTINLSDPSLPAGTPMQLFQSERWDPLGGAEMAWAFPVQPGPYTVRLYFAETYGPTQAVGARVFNAGIEGQQVLTNYDIFANVGANKGVVKTFNVNSDSSLNIVFGHVTQNPAIKAIEILQDTAASNQLGVSSGSLDFGNVTPGQSASKPLTLTNLGGVGAPSITIDYTTISGTDATAFGDTFVDASNVTLAPGQSTTINVSFSPGSTGTKSANLAIVHTGLNTPLNVALSGTGATSSPGFGKSQLQNVALVNPTSLQWGPDGKLYVAQQDGLIKVLTVVRQAANSYAVTATQAIDLIKSIPNHDDNGSLNPSVVNRMVTGLLVTGTAANPILYVSSSDPRIGGGSSAQDTNLDTNSGIISRLTWNGSSWSKVDLVRGLPRSEENHASNGMALNTATNTLYVAQGGNTNMGAPSNNFAYLPEYALSAAVLSINLGAIGNSTYDLPTLDDENRAGTVDAGDPFGGNDGKNQTKLVPGGPVQVYSPGYRNPYDVVIAKSGKMYTIDNGANAGWGDVPIGSGGSATNQVHEPGVTTLDNLHLVTPGFYAGHPNPTRANPNNTFNTGNPQSPVSSGNPAEGTFLTPGVNDGALALFNTSTNGLAEYTASNFGGAMQGNLLAASYDNKLYRVQLNSTGTAVAGNGALFSTVGSVPLDVTTIGDAGPFPGTIWVCDWQLGTITAFEPGDYVPGAGVTCTGADDPALDEDHDGYNNHDEILNGTNCCSSADVPPDWDKDFTSNLLDGNDDNDGLPDTSDPFAIDAANGRGTALPVDYTWDNNAPAPGKLLNLGFTGLMTNGTSNYESLYNPAGVTAGGAAGVLTIDQIGKGTAKGASNAQTQAFQFGINVGASSAPFEIHTALLAPFSGLVPQGTEEIGVFFGTGDQDNFAQLVVTPTGASFLKEVAGAAATIATSAFQVPGPQAVDLYLAVNPATGLIQSAYQLTINGVKGSRVGMGSGTTVPLSWFTSAIAPAVGIIGTAALGTPFPATWDFIKVSSLGGQSPFGGTPIALPGLMQAENYDQGGEGVAYHDVDAANLGNAYRTSEGVDLQGTTDAGGGYNVGWIKAGEWLEYTTTIASSGAYTLGARVASSGQGGSFHVEVDGVNVTGPLTMPNTGGWQNWLTISASGINLAAGNHVVRFVADTNGQYGYTGNLNWLQFTPQPTTTSTPFSGTPIALPGTVQVENFDKGGQGVAYSDSEPTNLGGQYRSEGVDIESTTDAGGGYNVGWTKAGEWLGYSVNIATSGTYNVGFRVASTTAGGKFHLEVDGVNKTGSLTMPNTGGWQMWQTLTSSGLSLTGGVHTLKLVLDTNASNGYVGNLNWVQFTQVA